MSENDPTKDIGAKSDTKPTIETILAELRDFRAGVESRITRFEQSVEARFDALDIRLDRVETLLDRVASTTFETRAGLRDLKRELNATTKHGGVVSAGTINNELAMLSRVFTMAVDNKALRQPLL